MAIPIKTIPILDGESAERFIKEAESNFEKSGTIDYSKQVEICKQILEKSDLNY